MAVRDVVLFFHAALPQYKDWLGRSMKAAFKTPPIFIDCGSGRSMKCADAAETVPCSKSGKGWGPWLRRYVTTVPRSTNDPQYKTDKVSTHVRRAILHNLVLQNAKTEVSANDQFRVCLVGFSEGCQALKALLSPQPGGVGMDATYIDSVLAIDGIHCMKPTWVDPNDGKTKACSASCVKAEMEGWIAYANLAAWSASPGADPSRMLVVTNSATAGPPCCYSTTWTSRFIYNSTIAGISANPTPPLPPGIWSMPHNPPFTLSAWKATWGSGPATVYNKSPTKSYSGTGNLWIIGYDNIDTQGSGHNDHVYQCQVVMPLMLERFLAPRWNGMSPGAGVLIGV